VHGLMRVRGAALVRHRHTRKRLRPELPHDGLRHRRPRHQRNDSLFAQLLAVGSGGSR
jgi:hypothetical protein